MRRFIYFSSNLGLHFVSSKKSSDPTERQAEARERVYWFYAENKNTVKYKSRNTADNNVAKQASTVSVTTLARGAIVRVNISTRILRKVERETAILSFSIQCLVSR